MCAGVFNSNTAVKKYFFVTSQISLVVILASHSCTAYQWRTFIEADEEFQKTNACCFYILLHVLKQHPTHLK